MNKRDFQYLKKLSFLHSSRCKCILGSYYCKCTEHKIKRFNDLFNILVDEMKSSNKIKIENIDILLW